MRMPALIVALAVPVLAAWAAQGQTAAEAFLSVCGDPKVSAREAARTCGRALDAGGLTTAQTAAAALNLGAALQELGQPDGARAAYDRAVAARPDWAPALAGRAGARAAVGDRAGAAADWDAAVKAAPHDAGVLGGRGAFRLRTGDAAGALADLDRARGRAPEDVTLMFNRALALAALGRAAQAEAGFGEVIRRTPDDAGAWLERGRLRAGRDRAAALADYARAVDLAGDWPEPLLARGALLDAMGRTAQADADFRRAWEMGHRSEALNARILRMGN